MFFSDHQDSKFIVVIILPLHLKDWGGQGARLFNSNPSAGLEVLALKFKVKISDEEQL